MISENNMSGYVEMFSFRLFSNLAMAYLPLKVMSVKVPA